MIRKTKVVVETSNEPIYGQNFSEIPTNELDGNSSSDSEEEKKEEGVWDNWFDGSGMKSWWD